MSTAHYGRAVPLALRRFVKLPCVTHGSSKPLLLPSEMPNGVHVVLLLNRLRQIEHADSWLSVRVAWERLLKERGIRTEGDMQMYICCVLPWFPLLRWWWHWRMQQWSQLLQEEHPSVHLLSTSTRARARDFYTKMQIPNDSRCYAMVIRNNGEILWASHDKFQEHLQEKDMVRTVNEECDWRITEQDRLLEFKAHSAIEAGDAAESGSTTSGGSGDSASGSADGASSAGEGGGSPDEATAAASRSEPASGATPTSSQP